MSCHPLGRSRLRLRLFGLDRREDLCNLGIALHAPEVLLTGEQHRPEPSLQHAAALRPFAVPLAVPNQQEHALDRVGGYQRLAQQRRHLQPMEDQELLERFPERRSRRLILRPQPRLQLPQHPLSVGIARLFYRRHEPPMRLCSVWLGQMPLESDTCIGVISWTFEATGATLLFLSPCSPDINPIEHDFAALKKRREYQETVPLEDIVKGYQ